MTSDIASETASHGHQPTVHVAVYTTSGAFPIHGQTIVPEDRAVRTFLTAAAHALHLTDTANWIVTVDGREINPDLSYRQNGLTGTVTLSWGPREGGGG